MRPEPSRPSLACEEMKVAIVATHPIQYHIPWFQGLAAQAGVELKVYFAMLPTREQQGVGFNVPFTWDIPMLEGYEWEVLPNAVAKPQLGTFRGSSVPSIRRILAANRPDAVIITGWHALPLLQALWACIRLGIPRLVRGESNTMRSRPLRIRLLHRLLLAQFDAVLTIGRSSRQFYLQNGVDAARLFPTDYFVDNQRFQNQLELVRDQRAMIRARWNIPADHTCYLYVGKLEQKKRILDLLAALGIARGRTPSIHLLVVGTGDLMAEAVRVTAEGGLPVTFAGFLNQTEISQAYAAADCLVLPSDYGETWGLVVNEAMASGLPAIVSDRVGSGPDLVEAGSTGDVFPFGDSAALGELLVRYADQDLLASMGRRARRLIEAYSVERAVGGTVRAFEFVGRKGAAIRP